MILDNDNDNDNEIIYFTDDTCFLQMVHISGDLMMVMIDRS